ncbi:DUF924 family protein [Palleronia sp. LCG004]|uniref:DUF924 family protein n=1 Tax=Palleronia sp. LCG004 TaxID=3079304 RepID=UPI0029422898|nr:DUF924 family protein [Palleronia sp. LCG004]WOI57146.1 DUF924 family protein [Palleronia sp. LCG004]
MSQAEEIIRFWVEEVGPKGWYAVDDDLDRTIRERFGDLWAAERDGVRRAWCASPEGALAYLTLTDQFPRNMFRGDGRAFALDRRALAAAKQAIARDWDLQIDGPARQFFYLPLMHSEILADQDRCVRLFVARMPEAEDNLFHARAHREVIRNYGRFPYRNAALGRRNNAAEDAYLDAGGYAETIRMLKTDA